MANEGRDMNAPEPAPAMAEALEVETTPAGAKVRDSAGVTHYLNPSAAAVLLLCDGTQDAAAIAGQMKDLFDLDQPPVTDVLRALDQLEDLGLLRSALG